MCTMRLMNGRSWLMLIIAECVWTDCALIIWCHISLLICVHPHSFNVLCILSTCICVRLCGTWFQDLTMKLSLIQSVGLIAKAMSECVKKQGYIFSRKQELISVMMVSVCELPFHRDQRKMWNVWYGGTLVTILLSFAVCLTSLARIFWRQSQLTLCGPQCAVL